MNIKTKTFALGSIQYRLPNVVESMRLLGKLGVKSDGSMSSRSEFEVMADMIENLAPLIVKIEATKGEQPILTWDEALTCSEFIQPLSEIANEVLMQFGDHGEKGKRRKKS